MASQYIKRPQALRELDLEREKDYNWFLSQQWVGMALYCKGFAENLQGLQQRLHYFQDLGINMVHVMPIMQCPEGSSDGGYAVSDFREINPDIGTLEELQQLAKEMRQRDILLVLDVVVNHTSNQHYWA